MYLYVEIASTELQSYRYPLFASSLISILYPDIFYPRIVGLPLRKRKKRQSEGCQGTVEPWPSQHSSRNSLWSFVWQLTQRWYDVCRWPNMYINGLFSAVLWQDMLLTSRIHVIDFKDSHITVYIHINPHPIWPAWWALSSSGTGLTNDARKGSHWLRMRSTTLPTKAQTLGTHRRVCFELNILMEVLIGDRHGRFRPAPMGSKGWTGAEQACKWNNQRRCKSRGIQRSRP